MHKLLIACLACAASLASAQQAPASAHRHSAYASQQQRDIKALSSEDTQALLAGQGMGYAKAAELNGYPGPMHVLEHAEALHLTSAQRAATQSLMTQHKAEARALGAQLVKAEAALDDAFKNKAIDAARLTTLTDEIGRLQAQLRRSHLATHLAQTALMTPEQIGRYAVLRGYDQPTASHDHKGRH